MSAAVVPDMSTCRHALSKGDDRVYRLGERIVAPELSAEMLAYAYMRFRQEGLLRLIFYEGDVGIRWFLEKYHELSTLGCFRQKNGVENADLLGMGWLNTEVHGDSYFRRSEVGMAFFREVSPEDTLIYSQMMLEWAFDNLKIDAMFGTTPIKNRAAVAHVRRLGFDLFGPIPSFAVWHGEPVACWISAMTKEQWRGMEVFEK